MEPLAIIGIIGILATGAWLAFLFRRKSQFPGIVISKSPSQENLASMVPDDPTPVVASA